VKAAAISGRARDRAPRRIATNGGKRKARQTGSREAANETTATIVMEQRIDPVV
jgi:hypothetical protein